jgi:ABC-type multidrug transport system fused ATPase/permease subunit
VEINVMRIGILDKVSEVHYETEDASAKAGVEYEATSGTLTFPPDVSVMSFTVQINSRYGWNPTTDFRIILANDESLQNATLDHYLRKCRVKVVNQDLFPTNVHEEHIQVAIEASPPNMDAHYAPYFQMLYEYMKWNLNDDIVRVRTIRKVVFGALHNFDAMLSLYLSVYLIDFVLNPERDADELLIKDNKLLNLIIVGTCRLFTKMVLHICDYVYTSYDMTHPSSVILHTALIERYLNYDENSRKEIHSAFISMGMMSDVPSLVKGYSTVIQGVQQLGTLVALLIYQFSIPVILHRHFMWESMSITFIYPICAAVFFYCRNGHTSHLLDMANKAFHSLAQQVHETVRCYPLIAHFKKRSLFTTRIREASQGNNNTRKEASLVVLNNNYYALWLGRLSVGFYTLFGGIKVIRGDLPLGLYLTNIGIFEDYARVWSGMYDILLGVQDCFPSLEHVMVLLNMPDDLMQRREVISSNLHGTCTGISGHRNTMQASQSMPLAFEDIKINFRTNGPRRELPVNLSGRMDVNQGRLVCISGPYSEGRSTLVRIIASATLPDPSKGSCFVPSHLRVLNIDSVPLFFKGTLMENLLIDVQNPRDGSLGRVNSILQRLMVITPTKKNVERLLTSKSKYWWEDLAKAELELLNLARALLSNSDLLCVHKPLRVGVESQALVHSVLQAFRDFVDERGLEQDASEIYLRELRTCIYTSNKQEAIDIADDVFLVSHKNGIQKHKGSAAQVEGIIRELSGID